MSARPLFQLLEDNSFDVIQLLYGQDCLWNGPEGLINDLVLFNDPTAGRQVILDAGRGLSHRGYDNTDIQEPYIEYQRGHFDGLYDSVFADGKEYVLVNDKVYICSHDNAKYDGQTYIIYLQKSDYQLYMNSISIGTI